MNKQYKIKKSYRDNTLLRKSFNELAKATFALDFEDWYQNGYWRDNYNPYSIIDKGEVVASASVNVMNFDCIGKMRKYIQIGTVMTKEAYRNQGLSRRLIEEIIEDYRDSVDGFFLFANKSVLDFYPKFGFKSSIEYQYSKAVHNNCEKNVVQVPMKNMEDWKRLERAIENSVNNAVLDTKHNVSLIMFYITKFMNDNVFYLEKLGAYVIAEINEESLILFGVYSPEHNHINEIIEAFGADIKEVTLCFTPLEKEGFLLSEVHEDDTLFLLGKDFNDFENQKMRFSVLAHA
jgi:GNAT superfamily N-acetyltransferase